MTSSDCSRKPASCFAPCRVTSVAGTSYTSVLPFLRTCHGWWKRELRPTISSSSLVQQNQNELCLYVHECKLMFRWLIPQHNFVPLSPFFLSTFHQPLFQFYPLLALSLSVIVINYITITYYFKLLFNHPLFLWEKDKKCTGRKQMTASSDIFVKALFISFLSFVISGLVSSTYSYS